MTPEESEDQRLSEEQLYRAAAVETYMARYRRDREIDDLLSERRAYRAGREDAARDIVEHADRWAPADGNVEQRRMRRHLMIAVQVVSPKATPDEIAEAVGRMTVAKVAKSEVE